jgi:disulfide bond formation protein DsbB
MRSSVRELKSILLLSGILEFILIVMMGTALYFQHHYGLQPCEACIQIRLMVLVMLIGLQFIALPSSYVKYGILSALTVLNMWILERAVYLIRIESDVDSGAAGGSCNFNELYPSWLPLDHWMPDVFEVRALCGESTEMFSGITMPEAVVPAVVFMQFVIILIGILVYRKNKGS